MLVVSCSVCVVMCQLVDSLYFLYSGSWTYNWLQIISVQCLLLWVQCGLRVKAKWAASVSEDLQSCQTVVCGAFMYVCEKSGSAQNYGFFLCAFFVLELNMLNRGFLFHVRNMTVSAIQFYVTYHC